MEIILQPVAANLGDRTLIHLAKDISVEFKDVKVNVASSIKTETEAQFRLAFDRYRNQWYSPKLLDWFLEKFKPTRDTKVLVIFDVDAYSNGLNYVLGEAFPNGGLGIVYLPRIKEEFYGQKPNDKLFYERMAKECVHELGHIFGFAHCPNVVCVMHFSNTLSDTDIKRKSFCDTCKTKKPIF
jgi:archaemetzincin